LGSVTSPYLWIKGRASAYVCFRGRFPLPCISYSTILIFMEQFKNVTSVLNSRLLQEMLLMS